MLRKTDSNNPSDWLWFAEADLVGIRLLADQQASFQLCRSKLSEIVEKIVKAELIHHGWYLQKTHDLERLLECLRDQGSPAAALAEPLCDVLADAYFASRYPGFDVDIPDWVGLQATVTQCEAFLGVVKARVQPPA